MAFGDKVRLLLVEDSPSNALVYRSYLEPDYDVVTAHTGAEALSLLNLDAAQDNETGDADSDNEHPYQFGQSAFSLLLLDVRLPDMTGLDILDKVRGAESQIPVIIMTAHGSVDMVVDAMRRGANDFLSKPFDKARLQVTLRNCLKEKRLSEIVDEYEKTYARQHFHRMVGASLPMQSVYRIIESAASSRATVFITGESGTGKELCAEAIHQESNRADKPYVPLNCAAIPRDLLESEIFGHVKGAFTGAATAREGAASRAAGGTLFLDEIGEMPMELQSKLLRFIQSGTFQPVGSSKEIKVDVRFICATNRDPLEEVRQGRFREDLYYRLHVIPIQMPPLRERGRDCLSIANAMLAEYVKDENKSFQQFSAKVEQDFLSYDWPGNVRELSNIIRNVVVLNEGTTVEKAMLPASFSSPVIEKREVPASSARSLYQSTHSHQSPLSDSAALEGGSRNEQHPASVSQRIEPLWVEEKRIIERAIENCHGNLPRAAAFLEISASTIYRKKQQWERAQNCIVDDL